MICVEGKNKNFFEMRLHDRAVTIIQGKFGVKGRATTKNFTSVDEARTFMSQTTSEKAALGYSVKRSKFHLCSPIYS